VPGRVVSGRVFLGRVVSGRVVSGREPPPAVLIGDGRAAVVAGPAAGYAADPRSSVSGEHGGPPRRRAGRVHR
jgi:hypothetical protein